MTTALATLATVILNMRLQFAQTLGVDTDEVLRRADLTAAKIRRPLARMTQEQDWVIWREIANLADEPLLGLKFGRQAQLSGMGILGYIIMNSATVAAGLRRVTQYERLFTDVKRMGVVETAETIALTLSYENWPNRPEDRYIADCLMATTISLIYGMAGEVAYSLLQAVHFHYPRPPESTDWPVYQEIFGHVPLYFGCPDTRCVFSRKLETVPILGANPQLLEQFEQQGQTLLAQYGQDSWRDRVCQTLVQTLQGELPSLNEIATILQLSPRSLQLKLQAENTSFQTLLNEVRREMAIECLRSQQLKKVEIAYLLGFSGASAFSRTFKKWTGYSPSAFQRQP